MPEEVCADVARELLKHVLCSASGKELDVLAVVRALKTFRALNATFRDAYEVDRLGCRALHNYVIWVYRATTKRIGSINRFLKMRARAAHDAKNSRTAREATDWIVSLRSSLGFDLLNYRRFTDALRCKLAEPCCFASAYGLPKGRWKLSPSHERTLAPRGTTQWAENLLVAANPSGPERRACAQQTVKRLFRITKEEECPHEKMAREMLECIEKMDLSDLLASSSATTEAPECH